jgi:hypothetical protein
MLVMPSAERLQGGRCEHDVMDRREWMSLEPSL